VRRRRGRCDESGDGDFVPAVKAVQPKGIHVENAHFVKQKSYDLINTCDVEIILDKSFFSDTMR